MNKNEENQQLYILMSKMEEMVYEEILSSLDGMGHGSDDVESI